MSESRGYARQDSQRYIPPPNPNGHVAGYEPLRPVVAAWSLEFAEATAAVFAQLVGNQVRIIGSRSWDFAPLSDCFADVRASMPWKVCDVNVLPPETSGAWAEIFAEAELWTEYAPEMSQVATVTITRELFPLLQIDQAARPWEPEGNNVKLIESLNGYRAEPMRKSPDTFSLRPSHSWEVYLARALELLALWRHWGGQVYRELERHGTKSRSR